jgi:mRNA interferase MazF
MSCVTQLWHLNEPVSPRPLALKSTSSAETLRHGTRIWPTPISRLAMASPGDVWLTDFGDPYPGEPANHRPALVIGPIDAFGQDFPFAVVVPLTTTRRGLSLHIEVEGSPENGLHETSYAQCELLRSINRRRLVERLGNVDAATLTAVEHTIRSLLGY